MKFCFLKLYTNIIIISMLIFQEDYQNKLSKIRKFACSKSTKIEMINALLAELKAKTSLASA